MASRHERLLRITERNIARGVRNRSGQIRTEDLRFEGSLITVDGNKVVDFGSCAYLALNRDPKIKRAAFDAVDRFGTAHSSSPMYTAVGLYETLEQRLEQMLGASVVLAPTTTLAHLAALPVIAGPDDLVLVDQHAHASLHLATDVLRGRGVSVETVAHNSLTALTTRLESACHGFGKVWYVTDGVFSMIGDVAPASEVNSLLDRFPNLHVYYDDAHGFGWCGKHGRGYVLDQVPWHRRMIVAAGLSKSFGTTGGFLAFGDPALATTVRYTGGPFTFSGPLQPASLGASVAAADFHLSDEYPNRNREFISRIKLARDLLNLNGLPVASQELTPIWFLTIGNLDDVLAATRAVMDDGYYVNPAGYPAVPLGAAGIRFTQTLHQTEEQLRGLVASLARHVPTTDVVIDLRVTSEDQVLKNRPLVTQSET